MLVLCNMFNFAKTFSSHGEYYSTENKFFYETFLTGTQQFRRIRITSRLDHSTIKQMADIFLALVKRIIPSR